MTCRTTSLAVILARQSRDAGWPKASNVDGVVHDPVTVLNALADKAILDVEGEGDEIWPRRQRERRQLRAVHRAIERIAFDGNAAGGADEALEFAARCEFRCDSASVVINLFFNNRAVEIIRPEAQCDLRDAWREHDPIRLDVLEIVEQQSRYSDIAQVGVTARLGNVRKRGVVRMKRQRDERHEPVRLVLQLAQLDEVIHALFLGFHVPVKHGGVRAQSDFVRLASDVEPHLAADLVVTDDPAHARMENLRSATGKRIDAGLFQLQKYVSDG